MSGEFIRSFSKFFTNLTQAQRSEIDRAFADMQNSKELTSLDTSLRNLRRKPDQRLPIPQPTAEANPRGAVIKWPALSDQYVNFYECDVSTFSSFSSFTTITTFGTELVLDGLSVTKFVRVRGVRRDGTTTPYSDALVVIPDAYTIRAHTAEAFYVTLEGFEYNLILGGAGSDLQYTPANTTAKSMVWGFLTAYGDPGTAMFGRSDIQIEVWATHFDLDGVKSSEVELWRVTLGEFYNSICIGPLTVDHPAQGYTTIIDVRGYDFTTEEDLTTRTRDATRIEWIHLNVMEAGS